MDWKKWAKTFGLPGILVLLLFSWYLIDSNELGIGLLTRSPAQSPFMLSNLSIQPEVVRPNEVVTITVSVNNTHKAWGIYSLVLNINGMKEAEKQADVDAGSSQNVSFTVTRESPGRYFVFVNSLSGSFTVATRQSFPAERFF